MESIVAQRLIRLQMRRMLKGRRRRRCERWITIRGIVDSCQDKGSRVVLGRNRHNSPPPINSAATMNVGAGQYKSSNVAITMLPIIPPKRAATIEIATPVALQKKNI